MHSHNDNFHGLGIAPKLLELLSRSGFEKPTPIQQQCIPVAIDGNDLVGIAQTGTGKTLAFGIPMLQSLVREEGEGRPAEEDRRGRQEGEQHRTRPAEGADQGRNRRPRQKGTGPEFQGRRQAEAGGAIGR